MIKKDFSKKLGILGVSFALMASPLAFADMHDEDEPKTGTRQESDLNDEQSSMNSAGAGAGSQDATDVLDEDEPNAGTRQESDLDDDRGSISSVEGDDDDTAIPGTGEESEPPTGTRGQPDEE